MSRLRAGSCWPAQCNQLILKELLNQSDHEQKIIVVAGARPNFMKVAPILAELRRHRQDFQPLLVHTGQHYDYQMSEVFFDELDSLRPIYTSTSCATIPTSKRPILSANSTPCSNAKPRSRPRSWRRDFDGLLCPSCE